MMSQEMDPRTEPFDLLIVGPQGGRGGTGVFVEEQTRLLSDYADIRVHNTLAGYDGDGQFLSAVLVSLLRFLKFCVGPRPDVVHINTSAGLGFYRSSLYILFSAYVWSCPTVVYTRGSGFDEFVKTDFHPKRAYLSFALAAADTVLVLTDSQGAAISDLTGGDNVRLLRQCTEVEAFTPEFDHETPRLLFLSSFIARKGIQEFVQAVDDLFENEGLDCSDVTVSIAGDGPFRDDVLELAERYECVEYHGYVTGDTKLDLFNSASIYVLPTYAEGFPSSIIEAMAGGNAIITTDVSGIPEVIGEENGIIVDPGNIELLVAAMKQLIETPDEVRAMSHANREAAESNHSWSSASESLLTTYAELLDSSSA